MPEKKKRQYTEAQNKATQKYIKENLEEIRFRVKKGEKDKYKLAADKAGLSMAKFFIIAANEKIDRDNQNQAKNNKFPNSSSHFPITGFPPEEESQIDLTRLLSDFLYQIDISAAYGNEVLASLLDKARKQQAAETK